MVNSFFVLIHKNANHKMVSVFSFHTDMQLSRPLLFTNNTTLSTSPSLPNGNATRSRPPSLGLRPIHLVSLKGEAFRSAHLRLSFQGELSANYVS